MNMTGRQKAFRNIVMTAAAINIILNLILTPNFGIYGAAISGMTSIIFWNLYTLAYIKKKHGQTI
ncbi:polysaccharide biosynthesis C-terminal domain-containing protein, partial [Desulfonatronospira sp.]|uniref:polysaccharide biosynthesis C-terminal domain-containing protein n=1 Tax=Desulfonatronospira sp. TaxID=1962951 RepID=UPI0025C4A87B